MAEFRWLKKLTRTSSTIGVALVLMVPVAASATNHNIQMSPASAMIDKNWAMWGRTYDETHYSPLDQINSKTIGKLGLVSHIDLPTSISALSEPLAVDGILYFAVGHSIVYAANPVTGKILWTYDPHVTAVAGDKLKRAYGIRGLAYADGHLFVGTQDGRLLSIDAKTGALVWSVLTTEPGDMRIITGAPRVFKGKVIIGHAGADVSFARGYVTAYDAGTGKQLWRFYTVPGDPSKGFENKAMEMAAKTWTGDWWKFGGGGTAWNAITFDPQFNRVYIGVGNGAPWNRKIRSPDGGDNLFLCSIVALDADTGAYVWHYQTTPGESWDYTSAQDIELAALRVGGKTRQVIMHAPKNGFFYVIDRENGKLISAEPFTKVTWASRIDPASGRPVENPGVRYENGETLIFPGGVGGHNWQPMSFSPKTGLVYIPTSEVPGYYNDKGITAETFKPNPRPTMDNSGVNGVMSGDAKLPEKPMGGLLAWDPVKQREVWRAPLSAPLNGGVLSSAGNLVFQGHADGMFVAYDAETGKVVWSFHAQNGIIGAPISYEAGGKQYITVIVGYSGMGAGFGPVSGQFGWHYRDQARRVLTFAVGGTGVLPRQDVAPLEIVDDPDFKVDVARATRGDKLYGGRCMTCHGWSAIAGGTAPDLRASSIPLSAEAFSQVVHEGLLEQHGMPKYDELSPSDLEDLRHFIRARARKALAN